MDGTPDYTRIKSRRVPAAISRSMLFKTGVVILRIETNRAETRVLCVTDDDVPGRL